MDAPTTTTSSSAKILVINHDSAQLNLFVIGLQLEGLEAEGVTDPIRGLEMLSESKYDMALVDLMIPRMNGLQISRAIRDGFPGVKTVLMSEYLLSPVQLAKADLGVVGFVPKPFKIEQLISFIKLKLQHDDSRRREEVTHSSSSSTSRTSGPFDILKFQLAV